MTTARRPRNVRSRGILDSGVSDWDSVHVFDEETVGGWVSWPSSTDLMGLAATREPAAYAAQSLRMAWVDPTEELRHRLDNANDYFKRKANEVFTDDVALRLLAAMYQSRFIEIADFDPCKQGIALAKLTAANFAEIGANIIYITESGQRFIKGIEDA